MRLHVLSGLMTERFVDVDIDANTPQSLECICTV